MAHAAKTRRTARSAAICKVNLKEDDRVFSFKDAHPAYQPIDRFQQRVVGDGLLRLAAEDALVVDERTDKNELEAEQRPLEIIQMPEHILRDFRRQLVQKHGFAVDADPVVFHRVQLALLIAGEDVVIVNIPAAADRADADAHAPWFAARTHLALPEISQESASFIRARLLWFRL